MGLKELWDKDWLRMSIIIGAVFAIFIALVVYWERNP